MKLLIKTFNILNLFLNNETEMSLSELAELSGLNKSTVNRIASTLVKYGYLNQREKRGKYSLGFKYFDFTGIIKRKMKIRDVAIPHLMRLTQSVDESAILAIWTGGKVAITETFHANHTLRVVPDEGTQIPLHGSSLGKIILANLTDKELTEYYNSQILRRYTSKTITSFETLKNHLSQIKQQGIAIDDEESFDNIRSIAAAIRGTENIILGSIGIIGPSIRLTPEKLGECIASLKKCASEISRDLGYNGEYEQVSKTRLFGQTRQLPDYSSERRKRANLKKQRVAGVKPS
jgi:IclR family transcriptional regulator, KDG regulon repressor